MDSNTSLEVSCNQVHQVNDSSKCFFVKETATCHDVQGFLNYIDFMYCDFAGHFLPVAVLICVGWLIILFLVLGSTADQFFCPSLESISKTLRLSQNVAGVTFLAFGNGAPDIFASIVGARQARPQLVIGALFGAGIFVTCIVAGSIMLTTDFKMMERPFLRDVVFYLIAVFWTFTLFYNGSISTLNSLGFIFLYILYMSVVLIGHHIYQKWIKPKGQISSVNADHSSSATSGSVGLRPTITNSDSEHEIAPWGGPPIIRKKSHSEVIYQDIEAADIQNTNERNKPENAAELAKTESSPLIATESNPNSFKTSLKLFIFAICPINLKQWTKNSWWQKILEAIKAPIILVLKLTIPVVDLEENLDGWCRPLNAFQCIASPLFICFAIGYGHSSVGNVMPVWSIVLLIGFLVNLILLVTTSNNVKPHFHCIFGFIGFGTSVFWIYVIASEIVGLLKTIGVVMNLSDTILGLTVLAWGNSISDLIADVSIAKQGFPKMGLSACYGGPLFNLLFGIGIPFTIVSLQKGEPVKLFYNQSVTILSAFLLGSLCISLVAITFLRFRSSRYFGIFLILFYTVFLVVSVLSELHIM